MFQKVTALSFIRGHDHIKMFPVPSGLTDNFPASLKDCFCTETEIEASKHKNQIYVFHQIPLIYSTFEGIKYVYFNLENKHFVRCTLLFCIPS